MHYLDQISLIRHHNVKPLSLSTDWSFVLTQA